jgi:tripartite-type tricarboxylate transporter receptor subunit TctC
MYQMKNMSLSLLLAIGLILVLGTSAMAAEYPTKPISLVVPFPPGGSADLTGRALANAATKSLGQPIIVENKAGGGGTVGPSLLITKAPDGYILGQITGAAIIAYHMGKITFNPIEDLTHIVRYGSYLYGIAVRADAPWRTLQEFIEYSKQNPGKVSYASSGVGTPVHLAMEELAMLAGVQWIHVPYKGVAESNTALLGGHVDAASESSGWVPLVDAGKFRLLATYGEKRSTRYPHVPTVRECGYDMVAAGPIGIMGPKGIPDSILKKLDDAFRKAMDDPEFKEVMKKFDFFIAYLGSENYEKFLRQDSERFRKLVEKLGLQKK